MLKDKLEVAIVQETRSEKSGKIINEKYTFLYTEDEKNGSNSMRFFVKKSGE